MYVILKDQDHNQCLHTEDLDSIKNDLRDIRTVLGIKDITNGEIKKRMSELGTVTEREDKKLHDRLTSLDNRLWAILIAVLIMILTKVL